MKIEILTIFPGMLEGPFGESMIRRAVERGLVEIEIIDLRSFASGRHRQVDDAPYGGGRGMVFKPEPLFKAVETLQERSGGSRARVILLTPQGRTCLLYTSIESFRARLSIKFHSRGCQPYKLPRQP